MKLKLTQVIEAEECTHEFLNDGKHLANHAWKVAKKKDGTYLIFHKVTNNVEREFKEKTQIYDNTWLLTLNDNTQCIMYFDPDDVRMSDRFLRLIKTFVGCVLIEKLDGKRKILSKKDFSEELDWVDSSLISSYQVVKVQGGGLTILRRHDLEVLDFEFDDYYFNMHITNTIIVEKDGKDCLVRISDFKTSAFYDDIVPYNISTKPIRVVDHVIVTNNCNDGKTIMNVENFEMSDVFKSIKPISFEYASVTDFLDKEQILRLSDFKKAKFD